MSPKSLVLKFIMFLNESKHRKRIAAKNDSFYKFLSKVSFMQKAEIMHCSILRACEYFGTKLCAAISGLILAKSAHDL